MFYISSPQSGNKPNVYA